MNETLICTGCGGRSNENTTFYRWAHLKQWWCELCWKGYAR